MSFTKYVLFTVASIFLYSFTDAAVRKIDCHSANICFALDGSASLNPKEFKLQRDFIKLLTSTFASDNAAMFTAVQYGAIVRYISRLVPYSDNLLYKINAAQSMRSGITFIAPGITSCTRQLRQAPKTPNKIVLLGDGRSNFDSREPSSDPKSVIQRFLQQPYT